MNDLKMTKLCAEAMGITGWLTADDPMVTDAHGQFVEPFDPLHDDAQCFALVKRFDISIRRLHLPSDRGWYRVELRNAWDVVVATADDRYLNRAIVECVAKMQAARTTESPVRFPDNATAK